MKELYRLLFRFRCYIIFSRLEAVVHLAWMYLIFEISDENVSYNLLTTKSYIRD